MTTKKTKGYTKVKTNFFKLYMASQGMFKNPNETLDKWIIRKTEESVYEKSN